MKELQISFHLNDLKLGLKFKTVPHKSAVHKLTCSLVGSRTLKIKVNWIYHYSKRVLLIHFNNNSNNNNNNNNNK